MRPLLAAALLAASPAAAQPVPAVQAPAYGPAPWWMREPVIASLGEVRTELPANRAEFSAAFESVERTAADAAAAASARVRALGQALTALGADRVRVEVGFSTRPLYAEYRDKEGRVLENQRADKVDRYAVTATVSVEVRDMRLLERAYALTVAAKPTSTRRVEFRLEPDNVVQAGLFRSAVADARRRAVEAAGEAAAKLGPVKLIDPSGRACQQDVLITGAPSGEAPSAPPMDVPPPPPLPLPATPAPLGQAAAAADLQAAAAEMHLPLQPPLQTLSRQACVVYALGG